MDTSASERAMTAWAFALGVGVLLHEFQAGRDTLSLHGLVVLAAVGLVLAPSSTGRLLILFGAFVLELLGDLPDPWNHTMLLGVLSATGLACWIAAGVPRPKNIDRSAFYATVRPILCAGLIVAWFAAALAKLNDGFLEANSCAVWMVEQVPGVVVPSGMHGTAAVSAILVELLVPVFLVIRRTRPLGVALAVGFHVTVAVAGHTAFSGLALSFYALFVADDVVADAGRRVRTWVSELFDRRPFDVAERSRSFVRRGGSGLPATWVVMGALAAALVALPNALDAEPRLRRWVPVLLFLCWALIAGLAMVMSIRERRRPVIDSFPPLSRPRHPATMVIATATVLILVFNAAMPYLGLKSLSSFTMYSDLRTEPAHWNHLVVPESVRLFDWQDDVVEIVEISDPELVGELGVNRVGNVMPALRIRVLGQDFPDARITYRIGNQLLEDVRLGDDPLVGSSPSAVQRWLGGIRPVDPQNRCMV